MKPRQYRPDQVARARALKEARLIGRAGATRLSDEVLFALGDNPSDTFIGLALDEFYIGQSERNAQ